VLHGRKSKLAETRPLMSSDRNGGYYGGPEPTSRIGAELREARERLGYTLPAVAATLRIRLPYLEAIEAGRLSELPGNAYAVGFLRAYAQALGLDPDEISRRFKTEAAEVNRKTELAFPAPVPERGIPAGAVVLVGAVIAIAAYIGWYRFSGGEHGGSDAVQAVPDRLAPLAAAPPRDADEKGKPASPVAAVIAPAPPEPAGPPIPPALLPPSAPNVGPREVMGPPIPAAILAASGAASVTPGTVPTPALAAADGSRIVLHAKSDAWVQVRERRGPVLLNRVMRTGETWSVPPSKAHLLLTTGNAASTELVVDGIAMPPLGPEGVVRRDLVLDPDALHDPAKQPTASSPQAAATTPSAAKAGTAAAIRTN
jgi:cytoskeleton protein RodZ